MKINQINLNGLDLISSEYKFTLTGLFDFDKEINVNDLMTDGSSYNSSKNSSKKLVLNGLIKTHSPQSIINLNRVLAGNGLKTLTVTIEGFNTVTADVEIINRMSGSNSRVVSMQLSMPKPYLYSLLADEVSLGSVSNNGLVFPLTFPVTFGNITGGEGIVVNEGNVIAYPVIKIVGECSNLVVTNQTTEESISINVSLEESDTLVIDNSIENRGIYLNGENRIDLKNGSWIHCEPGENVFSFARNSLEVKQHCTISLNSRWI